MLNKLMKAIFGDRHQRELKRVTPLVEEINRIYNGLADKSDEEIKARVQEIRTEIRTLLQPKEDELKSLHREYHTEPNEGKKELIGNRLDDAKKELKVFTQDVLDRNLTEVFALVKDTCRRLVGTEYDVRGHTQTWNMVPFDVQLIGGIALHEGKIAEMATGEGKTLVSVLPVFLNALTGRGVHIITVNDYLAMRDSEWMGLVYAWHGLTIGVIYTMMPHDERQAAYRRDITYGTNSEFGFDYLRDNMLQHASQLAQRELYYAVVDEVDSVLIDEARTPLIISGPVGESKNFYKELKPHVQDLFSAQSHLIQRLSREIREAMEGEKPDWDVIGRKLLLMKRGDPKGKAFTRFMKEAELKKLVLDFEGFYLRDKKMHELDEDLFYVIDEQTHSTDLSEKGRELMNRYEKDLFLLEQLDDLLKVVDEDESLDTEQRAAKKEELTNQYLDKNEKLHNISQLLKAYALYEKEVEYVVMNNQVLIVDEFTGRLMPGRRFSEGLHQALEAKEGVTIEEATQTLATITIQNYFRMYDKISGMTGTAITEETEFMEIYNLPVMTIPTNVPVNRLDHEDVVYLTKNDKYRAIIDEIIHWHNQGKPVLVGTVSVEVSEILSRLLQRSKIPHNVLNAKQHQREAEVIAQAGAPGAVTIATNMAGRGTDIKLGEGVVTGTREFYQSQDWRPSKDSVYGGPADGLHVIGTERHESRRIDRQLRGRAGRQGDPGTSRFYLSLEDDLMRLFGSDRIAPMMIKMGFKEGEAIAHPWMTKSVEQAQKRVELHNFDIRKNLLKYDEVMNQQRSVIYTYRQNVLKGYDLREEIVQMIRDSLSDLVDKVCQGDVYSEEWQFDELISWFRKANIQVKEQDLKVDPLTRNNLEETCWEFALNAYANKERDFGLENQREIERRVLLEVVDEEWREHLYEMDLLKESVSMRAYGQKDPLVEYKKEAFGQFSQLINTITGKVALRVYTTFLLTREQISLLTGAQASHSQIASFNFDLAPSEGQAPRGPQPPADADEPAKIQPRHVDKTPGRNDPCPCGSGKKYKKCCGRTESDDN